MAYIRGQFEENSPQGLRLMTFLQQHEPILDIVSMTSHLREPVCQLWKDRERDIQKISSQTELLNYINIFFGHRKADKKVVSQDRWRQLLHSLAEIAYRSLRDKTEFKLSKKDAKVATELGIFVSEMDGSSRIYHTIARDHLVATFLAKEDPLSTFRMFSVLQTLLVSIRHDILKYENVIRFLAGTSRTSRLDLMEEIKGNESLDKEDKTRILLDCVGEMSDNSTTVFTFMERYFIESAGDLSLHKPSVHTVAGLNKLPRNVKDQVWIILE